MDTNSGRTRQGRTARIALAGGVAGLGLVVGGIAIATADDSGPGTLSPGSSELERGWGDGDHGAFGGAFAARLADELGVEQARVEAALSELRGQLEPERPEWDRREMFEPPSEEELAAWQAELAAALAEALGVQETEVEAALTEIRTELEAQAEERFGDLREELRPGLVENLDEAVAGGTLTEADKESVLKAYDAGVLGGGIGGLFGHGVFGGHGPFGGFEDSAEGSTT